MVESDLRWLGLSDSKVAETIKNKSLTEQLVSIVKLAKQQLASVGQKLDVFPKVLFHPYRYSHFCLGQSVVQCGI